MKKPASSLALGAHLRRLRKARGWSQQVLADVADVTKKTIYRLETGQTSPTLDVLVCLAEGLEMPLRELVDFALPEPLV
ncbi:transcriptional regulator, XRE family [Hymenobacter roseosalivarius DSM 11622]|uniref:Transcriptional regulator, XRE family n=1 Tax=Hymenobacter roseosalivarius DSM 11622 TaxID=645990 RepID=A0A1W1UH30_9BACT|nr:helix-turn-helix transcriptional regulator [Hymenobacter roseosalivarius]SMB80332.1 transcriptional regulator, XRE family [Hymenobacter roseosalivarius DSM 11622]